MASETARHRFCRRVGTALCGLGTCPALVRPYPPGQHGPRLRHRPSDYETRLLEKQKLRALYQLSERQMRRYFAQASRAHGVTGDALLRELETRLDTVVFRLGFARTLLEARRLVSHGHVRVDGRRVNLPGAALRPGQRVELAEPVRQRPFLRERMREAPPVPPYLEREADGFAGGMLRLPERGEIPLTVPVQDLLIVEYYS